jgi:hypothetical protein
MAMTDNIIFETLKSILMKVSNSDYGFIYLQRDYPWFIDSIGFIYYTDIYNENPLEDVVPEFLQENNLVKVMSTTDAEDVITNAFYQKADVKTSEIIDCFNFYYKNDGFLKLVEP